MKRSLGLMVIGILFLGGCVVDDGDPDTYSQATLARFRTDEVQSYQGQRLDPAVGPRDNSIKGVQYLNVDTYTLTITGLYGSSVSLTYAEVIAFETYQRLITLYCVEGWEATILWEGVALMDLIALANPSAEVTTIIFHASDGYTTSLPLSTIQEKNLILAYRSNGLALPPEMGYPFIVVAQDKLGYKWARWVTEIELSSNSNYKGYWETLGYSNLADVE
jgi:DMSO/TMAO reductase YedYZ molybdopterin-dependent catalytic subunit